MFEVFHPLFSYLAPPICAVYLLAVFWPRTNEPGAFWGLMVGLIVGLLRFFHGMFHIGQKKSIGQRLNHPCRFGLEFGYTKPPCGDFESPQPPEWWFKVLLTLINIFTLIGTFDSHDSHE